MVFPALLVLPFALSAPGRAAPAQVLLIRHAEKPDDGPDLSDAGYERAQALVGFFENNPSVTQHGAPAAIYAMDPKGDEGSRRAIETVQPLADNLGLSLDTDYKKHDVENLALDILRKDAYDGKTVLVCWEHRMIPYILKALGWRTGPDTWSGDDYDSVWVLDFSGGKPYAFKRLHEDIHPAGN